MISIKDVQHVAKLARLSLTEDESRQYAEQLSRIIDYFDELKSVDTEGVEPMSHPIAAVNVLREDEVCPSLPREVLMANAPLRDGNFFRVPKIGE
ncbi:MAG: Asp-tRNA(Asn)/Glu-tRNA(Gln) amidotransferase subunit GatC [Candidatus Obscuribacter sp.]|nr:Asp-tRNA(Asn)/Glu-tRNA(Gln) amidotransferase subunit GatC [Candidatus Melainabacteria bacterium]MDX1985136.1 Asp-tRNA(Asn)/Glu-tRNA(Gln) amidotransferase subunit GatC [Candidatus Obscuribacter sp.]